MIRTPLACIFAISAALLTSCHSEETTIAPPVDPTSLQEMNAKGLTAAGFSSLFTNDSLEGFQQRMDEKAEFAIKDGVLTGKAVNMRSNSFLCTKKEYADFIIAFEFKFDHLEGNSGFMFRGLYNDEKGVVYGYQCEHDNNDRSWTAGLYDEKRRGWIYPKKKTDFAKTFTEQGQKAFKKDGWNYIVIKCVGNKIDSWLNGEHRIDLTDDHPEHATAKGFFGFQVHSGKKCDVRWRNVLIKEL